MTIVKASPDSKREFSVVTMVEDAEFPGGEIPDPVVESGFSPAVSHGGDVSAGPEGQREERSGAEGGPSLHQIKYDMMEMEDIRDCKVRQVQDLEQSEEEVEKIDKSQQDK